MRLIFISIAFLLFSCSSSKDSLDDIKPYKPNDKYFKASLVSLHFTIETSSIENIESQFNQLIEHYTLPIDAKACANGVFYAESPFDAYDYKHIVKLKVKDEQIIEIDYDEVHKTGKGKENDESYNKEMLTSGTSPSIAYPEYEQQLLNTQNMLEVDAVSGATYSLYRFRYAVTVALIKARLKN